MRSYLFVGVAEKRIFDAIPQLGEFRNIPCLKLLIGVLFRKGLLLSPMGGAFSFISF